jgi:hypothetical protein
MLTSYPQNCDDIMTLLERVIFSTLFHASSTLRSLSIESWCLLAQLLDDNSQYRYVEALVDLAGIGM